MPSPPADSRGDRSCEEHPAADPSSAEPVGHLPVLLERVAELLSPGPGQTYLDCTAGLGGHAAAVAGLLGPGGTVVLVDLDRGNLERAAERVSGAASGIRVETVHGSFAGAPRRMEEAGLRADMVLADLGFSSVHVGDAARGFSFSREGPLDMRYDPSGGPTAADLVRTLPEGELARIIYEYGEERMSRRIARKLVEARKARPIETTVQLAEIVRSVVRRGRSRIDPATRTFQALRIAVNDELGALRALLDAVCDDARRIGAGLEGRWLAPGARIAVIGFHSLEDRPVKTTFNELARAGLAVRLTKKPARAEPGELGMNPRARSAKLRAIRLPDDAERRAAALTD